MNVVWVNPTFLDYRVPVYAALDRLLSGRLSVVFSAPRTREHVRRKIIDVLGPRAIALDGEKRVGVRAGTDDFANVGVSVPYQPGLARAIAAGRPDVIVTEGFFQWTPASLWVKRRHGVPMVVAYERTAHTERNAPWWRTLYRKWICGQTNAVACNGQLSREYCQSVLGIEPQRIVTGAMAADTDALAARCDVITARQRLAKREELSVFGPLFLYVGQIIQRKGLHELLAGWAWYAARGGAGTLVLVGDGSERKALEETVRQRQIPRVVFAGRANYGDIALHYAAADVLVMPTLEDNWSLVVPEAMACGKPILCSKYNGCWPELVHPGLNGWVFDPANADQIADLLGQCAASPARLAQMGQESRRIVAGFTPAHAAAAVLKACEIAAANGHCNANGNGNGRAS